MSKTFFIFLIFLFLHHCLAAQPHAINPTSFFTEEKPVEVTLTTNIRKLVRERQKSEWQPAEISLQFDSLTLEGKINIRSRGIDRKEHCSMASLMFDFKKTGTSELSSLGQLKFVGACGTNNLYKELVLKEFLVYKIYNFLSEMSFRVRLIHIDFKDSEGKANDFSEYAFLIESIKDLASRNKCREEEERKYGLDDADRMQFNLVCIFQYMIGNTDWSVRQYHNIKLMIPLEDTLARPFVIPYDFDFCGFVNAPYAAPTEGLDIQYVTQRIYRGFERSLEEIKTNLVIFREKKDSILNYINMFPYLNAGEKKGLIHYLEDFYKLIDDDKSVRYRFIDQARVN